jgi:hypothetical protein
MGAAESSVKAGSVMRRIHDRNGLYIFSVALLILSAARPVFSADDPQDPTRPTADRTEPQVEGRIGARDAARLGDELLSKDFRITDRRITDARYLPSEKTRLRKELRLKAERYLPAEGMGRVTREEEKPAVTTQEENKKKKAETILQF